MQVKRSLIFTAALAVTPFWSLTAVAANNIGIKLFDATATFATGPERTPKEAVSFANRSLILDFAAGDSAVISSTPDGKGPIVIDSFMTINDVDVCRRVTHFERASCFGGLLKNPQDPSVIGTPIETVLQPIAPIDVSKFIPVGQGPVIFQLRDFGVIAGNTDLFLVTSGIVNLSTQLTPSPAALKQAFDEAVRVCRDSITTSARAKFNEAFTQQIANPLRGAAARARDGHTGDTSGTKSQTVDQISNQLNAAMQDLSDEINDVIEASLKNISESAPTILRSSESVRQLTGAPLPVAGLIPNIPVPQISTDQSIGEILAQGFDSTRVTVSWSNITATCLFGQDPDSATISPTLGVNRTCSDSDCSTDVSMAASVQSTVIEPIVMEVMCPDPTKTKPKKPSPTPTGGTTISCSGSATITSTPDLSAIGFIVAITSIVLLALWRKKLKLGTAPPL